MTKKLSMPSFGKRNKLRFIYLSLLVLILAACTTTGTAVPVYTPTLTPFLPATSVAGTAFPTQTGLPAFTPSVVPSDTSTATIAPTPSPVPTATSSPAVRFAVIGDYGSGEKPEADVAQLVKSWNPDFIITTGDNNYPSGSAATIDQHIGQFYHDYIYPYTGQYGPGAAENRFFPTLGNHDYNTARAKAYLDYFSLPGNERYYDFTWGPVQFFALDADSREPDGVSSQSVQAAWLKDALSKSTAAWKIVYFHQPPYSSGLHGSTDWMRWPFKEWGASAVLSGHDHTYERLSIDGLTYFVNGLGGGAIYNFVNILEGSQARYNDDYGAMLVNADQNQIKFEFITRQGTVIDTYSLP
jgi:hypothetical protein